MADEEESENLKSSEAIIADLLNDVKASEQPFSVDKLAGCDETDVLEKKRRKHHKHRSQHKSKKSRKRSRSRESSREKSHKSRKRSRSRSRRRESKEREKSAKEERPRDPENVDFKPPETKKENIVDDLPLGADFSTNLVKKDTKKLEISITTVLPKIENQVEDGEIEDIAYGEENNEQQVDQNEKGDEWSKVEKEKEKEKKKKKEKTEKKRRTSTSSLESDRKRSEKSRSSRRRSRSKERKRSRTPPRRRSPIPHRGRGESRLYRRSSSRERISVRRRSRSRDRQRREYDDYRRKRSRSREVIDKEKLLAIAKSKRAEMMSNGERDSASIEDFVTYCKRLQKRQEREKRREAGQAVSDHESDGETVKYKHPYAMPKDPIRINIITATSANLAQKALMGPEESTQLDASQLRIVFPVSSGAVHKENAEWIPVEKDDVPKSCSVEQKKHVALTSLEINRCISQGIPVAPAPIPKFLNSILPPPPLPPPLPSLPASFRPPTPPPLPSVLYVPQKEKMIIREPKDIAIPAPSDIGKVLKQRSEAQKKIYSTPNDFEAHRALREANEQIELWAALKSLPGEYTGTTGLKLLSADELQPHNPKYHAWVKRNVPMLIALSTDHSSCWNRQLAAVF